MLSSPNGLSHVHPYPVRRPSRALRERICDSEGGKTRAGEKFARLSVQIGNPKAEVAARKLFGEFGENGRCRTIDRRDRFSVKDEAPGRLRQAAHDPAHAVAHIIDIEEQ